MIAADCDHEAAKLEPQWARLAFVGHMAVPADATAPAELIELRNCVCGSTLGKLVSSPRTNEVA